MTTEVEHMTRLMINYDNKRESVVGQFNHAISYGHVKYLSYFSITCLKVITSRIRSNNCSHNQAFCYVSRSIQIRK